MFQERGLDKEGVEKKRTRREGGGGVITPKKLCMIKIWN